MACAAQSSSACASSMHATCYHTCWCSFALSPSSYNKKNKDYSSNSGCLLTYSFRVIRQSLLLWFSLKLGDFFHHNSSLYLINSGIFFERSYFLLPHLVNSTTKSFSLCTVHSQNFSSMLLSYSVLVFTFNAGFHWGHVILLHVWHCALIFSDSRHMFVNILLYLCHPANSSHSHKLLHDMHLHLPSSSVSLNLAFSCAIFIANCIGFILGHSDLYTLLGLHSNSLISFSIPLLYTFSFLFKYAAFFFSNFSMSCSNASLCFFFLFSIKTLNLNSALNLTVSSFFAHFLSMLSFVFLIKKKPCGKNYY